MAASFHVSADGFLQVRDTRRVRTPGRFERSVEAAPGGEALGFLLSHAFPGHRRVARGLTEGDRKLVRLAEWADSVNERMTLIDRVWRRVTDPAPPPRHPDTASLVQIVTWGDVRAYPLYLDGEVTRVIPRGGVAPDELSVTAPLIDLSTA